MIKIDFTHYLFLDDLRKSGVTNMMGATPYLIEVFPELSPSEGRFILTNWMEDVMAGRWNTETSRGTLPNPQPTE